MPAQLSDMARLDAPPPSQPCQTCGTGSAAGGVPPAFVYALGRVDVRFPGVATEKEYLQVVGRTDASGLTDRQMLQAILADRAHRYLARQVCWVLMIEGLETYLLHPRDPADLDMLIEAIRPTPRPTDVDVVIGIRGPLAAPQTCNGLVLPVVIVDQLYSFDVDALMQALPRPEAITPEQFDPASEELFARIQQLADNAGAMDEHRALNYLAVRYAAIYARAVEAYAQNASLTAVDARPSRLSGARRIIDVIFSFTNRQTDVQEQFFVRVDVTEEFPFLVTKLSPYYER